MKQNFFFSLQGKRIVGATCSTDLAQQYLLSTAILVQPYGAKKYPNCALRGKSTELGSVIVLDLLIILSYGPHRNTQGGKAQRALGGEGCNRFVWDGKYPEKGNKKGQNSFKFSFS